MGLQEPLGKGCPVLVGGGGAEAGHPQAATCLALGALSHLKLWLALSPHRWGRS